MLTSQIAHITVNVTTAIVSVCDKTVTEADASLV